MAETGRRAANEYGPGAARAMFDADVASRGLGMELLDVGDGTAAVRMRVGQAMVNGHGIAHGGYVFLLADTAFACACNSRGPVTVAAGADITFIAPVREDEMLVATAAERVSFGRSGIYDVTVRRGDEVVAEFPAAGRGRLVTLAEWLRRAIAYEIYPQSFADSGGDGIGDLRGIIDRLGYLAWLGVDVLWLNPCFASPMRNAGYDISDYLRIAPRYGTNDDLAALVEAARGHGIRVLLDLVAGHTSDQHPWFTAAANDVAADPAHDRYIFTGPGQTRAPGPQWVASPGRRPGWYLPNFFPFQPALNFGYARTNPAEPWRQPVGAPGPRANRAALTEIMAHWLGYGVAGFRVDLASTLVKDDPGWRETAGLWREIRSWLDAAFPDAVLMSEWNSPSAAIPAGFHADFYLAVGNEHRSLCDNGSGMSRDTSAGPDTGVNAGRRSPGPCYFSAEGTGSPERFLTAWRSDVASAGDAGLIAFFSSDHDFARPVCGGRSADQAGPVFAFLLTWPTLPGIHCGDEIGMRFVPGLPDVEGSQIWPGWNRAGSRTPMQWDDGPNAGFSAAPASSLYLPVDPDQRRPTVAAQRSDDQSLLHQVRRLIKLRKELPALRTGGPVQVLNAGYPLAYLRDGTALVVINPRREPASFLLPFACQPGQLDALLASGVTVEGGNVVAGGFGYGVFTL